MKQLAFSPKAAADLDEIYDYTEDQWGPEQAETYIAELEQACSSLLLHSTRRAVRAVGKSRYFVISCGSHRVWYRENQEDILIVRILHQRMDPARHL
ncbi:type II toxin-antitoxin system RelE/ParE family toxin [Pararhizobium sp. O133]|uniref:type II toxin-antitoxin system RelE/ParE family toxin n=1 Tax=Pararhizobium sp. O133 TaxID=3449278 RepID=UPI003F6878E7